MPQYLFTDVEASKLFDYALAADHPDQPRLAQIGMIFVGSDCKIESQHEFLIKPRGWMMSAEAVERTGLTTEHLEQNGGPIDEALDLYSRAIEGRRIIAGWNVANYDMKVMRGELRRVGKPDLFMSTRSMDLMQTCRTIVAAKDKRGAIKAPRLEEACTHFNIEQPKAHSGLADAMSVYEIWLRVIAMGHVPEIKDPYNRKPKKKSVKRGGRSDATQEEGDEIGIGEESAL